MTGVHIKSLRYYDRIGILKPAYIDPDTNYRYYIFPQLGIVDGIKLCVELDIPLKQFPEFIGEEGQEIHYTQLLEYGKTIAEQKIQNIHAGLREIDCFLQEIKRGEALICQNQPVFRSVPRIRYYTMPLGPLEKSPNYDEYDKRWKTLYDQAVGEGYTVGYETGLLYIYQKDIVQRYQFFVITSGNAKSQHVITLAAGRYLSKCVKQSRIEAAPEEFSEQFDKDGKKFVIESELFTGDFNIAEPLYELRCSAY